MKFILLFFISQFVFIFYVFIFVMHFSVFSLFLSCSVGNIEGGWSAVKEELAQKYLEGGYPDMANMIKS